jgi:hypothetical protein
VKGFEDRGSKIATFLAIAICIASLGWSLYFYSLYENERNLRKETDKALSEAQGKLKLAEDANEQLTRDLQEAKQIEASLVEERKNVERDLNAAKEQIAKLESDLQKAANDAKAVEELAKTSSDKEKVEQELTKVREEKTKLEMELQKRTGSIPGSVDVGEVKVLTGKRFSGSVLVVNKRYDFVVIDIGKDHGMETGVILILHRGKKFLGKVIVEKVYERMSAASIMKDWMQAEPEVGDGVKKY